MISAELHQDAGWLTAGVKPQRDKEGTRVKSCCDSALRVPSFGIFRMYIWKPERIQLIVWSADSPYRHGYWEEKHVLPSGGWLPRLWCLSEAVLLYFPSHQRNAGPDSCSVSRTASPAIAIRIPFPSHVSLLAMEFPTMCGFRRQPQSQANKCLFGHN